MNHNLRFLGRKLRLLLVDPAYFWILAALVIAGDVVLTQVILRFVSYTEIDWETYMAQVQLYIKGQREYSLITGPTGPLVYPAGHVYIHQTLYSVTEGGAAISRAQQIYAVLYIASLTLTCGIYQKAGGMPNWILLLLPLSKRLHSLFVLRLFNDCWALVAVQAAVLAFQTSHDEIGILLFSAALSVKMSILLYLPGLLVVLFKRHGPVGTLRYMATLIITQVYVATPFLRENPNAYLQGAFDVSRVFLYKWTVNWRLVCEDTFLSSSWARGLLLGHASILVAFGLFRWCKGDGGVWKVLDRGIRRPSYPAGLTLVSPDYVATVLFTSNLIGIIFARSLHYQFYSWYAQQLPFLAWRTRFPVVIKLALILGVEYAWNVFPSTKVSSWVLLACNSALLLGIWTGDAEGKGTHPPTVVNVSKGQ